MYEPIDTVFLSQVADGALHLGLVNEKDLDVVFKLNSLFFDHIAIGASGLLCNNLLYKYLLDERKAIAAMYKSAESGNSIIRPVLWYENNNDIRDAAKKMLEAETIHYLPKDEDLLQHAELLHELNPTYLESSECNFRDDYKYSVSGVIGSLLNSSNEICEEIGLNKPIILSLAKWLSIDNIPEILRCSDIYRFAEGNKFSEKDTISIKRVADTLYQYTLASSLWTEFSSPQAVSPIVQLAKYQSNPNQINKIWHNRLSDNEVDEFSSELPLQLILDLPLSDILLLRNLESFKSLRWSLSQFRSGKDFSLSKLQDSLNDCVDQLLECANSKGFQKKDFYKKVKEDDRKIVFRFIYDSSSLFAVPLALVMYNPDPVPVLLSTVISLSLVSANKYLSKEKASRNTIYPNLTAGKINYKPIDGNVSVESRFTG